MQPSSLSASTLKGDTVRNREGKKLGHLEELVIELDTGRVAYVVLASGGFLGIGDKFFAVPWDLVTVDTENREIVIDLARETLENAPGFDHDHWPGLDVDHTWMVDDARGAHEVDTDREHDPGIELNLKAEAESEDGHETGATEETGARST